MSPQEAVQPVAIASPGIFATIREALSGSQRDLTEGNLRRAIILLAIPMILEMLMESLFGVVDMFFVARLGVDSLATVALTESCLGPKGRRRITPNAPPGSQNYFGFGGSITVARGTVVSPVRYCASLAADFALAASET